MKEKIVILFICFNFYPVKAFKFIKKETLFNKVSFLYTQKNDSLYQKKYLGIQKLFNNARYPEALEKALPLLKSDLDPEISFKLNFLVAEIYSINNNHNISIIHYKNALNILELENNSIYDLNYDEYYEVEKIRTYLKLGNEYLRNSQIDSARYFYHKTLEIESLETKSLSYQASASTNLSGIHRKDSLYDLAKQYAIRAVSIHQKRNNKISEAAAKGNLASIFLDQNNYKEAKKTYKEALDLIKNESSDRALRVKENLYYNLAYNLYKMKDYEAYSFQELSYEIKDTLRGKEIRRIIEKLGFEYDFNTQKELLEKKQDIKLLEEKDRANTIVVISSLILIFLLVIITYYSLRQKNLQIKLSKTELLQSQKLDKLKSDSQVRILNATIDGKESERKEIAETLHDSVSALLSSANLHLQASVRQFEGDVPIEIDKTQKIINEASAKIRDLSHSLMSSVLLKFGLNFAIKDIAEKYSNSELSIDTQIGSLRRYDQNFEIKTYNIIQEFINNILKHSKADSAFIQLKEEEGSLILEISDDGIGFDKKKTFSKKGIGINQIYARIKMMKGKFKIITSKNNGTIIKVELPIQEREYV
ncbi:Signal transduction histidine kinase [Polaribacter sp. KT25b]|uniref:ATP-binding protein n=1 Tax=Polaribacter sp. KT25b TaxID=1855336 RepID=UPI000879DB13|nr:tetratricopeptide repeat-containing sensor histidine kinase [Polaribacter sp. KT25b]SDS30097.1 Signal transduction histidine kinase [Polaribacter sp. KT25b]